MADQKELLRAALKVQPWVDAMAWLLAVAWAVLLVVVMDMLMAELLVVAKVVKRVASKALNLVAKKVVD